MDVNVLREIQIICRLEKLERNDPKPKTYCYRWESCFLLHQIVLRYLFSQFHGPVVIKKVMVPFELLISLCVLLAARLTADHLPVIVTPPRHSAR